MKTIHTLAAASLLCCSLAQAAGPPPGFSPEAVNTMLPEEGAPKAEPGPYAVIIEPAFGNASLKVVRPANLDAFPKKDILPVLVWGHGGCAMDNARAMGALETIASHGFLIVTTAASAPATTPPQPGARRSATAADLKAGIDWAEAENQREGSPLKGKVQTKKVAVLGQSCGGKLAIELGADPRVGTIEVFNAGLQPDEIGSLALLHGPVLFVDGAERDFMQPIAKATYDTIDKLPKFYGSRHGGGHLITMYHPGGGEVANVAWKWVMWQFKGNKAAAAMFVGKKCGLCTNANWDVEAKRLK